MSNFMQTDRISIFNEKISIFNKNLSPPKSDPDNTTKGLIEIHKNDSEHQEASENLFGSKKSGSPPGKDLSAILKKRDFDLEDTGLPDFTDLLPKKLLKTDPPQEDKFSDTLMLKKLEKNEIHLKGHSILEKSTTNQPSGDHFFGKMVDSKLDGYCIYFYGKKNEIFKDYRGNFTAGPNSAQA